MIKMDDNHSKSARGNNINPRQRRTYFTASSSKAAPNNHRAIHRAPPREPHIPGLKADIELFDDNLQIKPGKFFDRLNDDEMEREIVVQGGDGNQPEYIRSFDECKLSPEIMKNIQLKKLGRPTLIQRVAIPLILQNKRNNIMAHATTGSGKTAAYLIPLINLLQRELEGEDCVGLPPPKSEPRVIIILPTRELTQQIYEDVRAFAVGTGVRVGHSYGDIPIKHSLAEIADGCDIFVATCGRLRYFIIEKLISMRRVNFIVLDEADRLLGYELAILNTIKLVLRHVRDRGDHLFCRTLLFSATFSEEVQELSKQLLGPDSFFISVSDLNSTADTILQHFAEIRHSEKQSFLLEYLKEKSELRSRPGGQAYFDCPRTIVFVNTKLSSDRLAIALAQEKFEAMSLNSDRTLRQRIETVEKFRRRVYHVLVATDVAARGLNFPTVDFVVNFDLPPDPRTYVHRVGRTGRAGNMGQAMSFFDPDSEMDRGNAGFYAKKMSESMQDEKIPEFLTSGGNEVKNLRTK